MLRPSTSGLQNKKGPEQSDAIIFKKKAEETIVVIRSEKKNRGDAKKESPLIND